MRIGALFLLITVFISCFQGGITKISNTNYDVIKNLELSGVVTELYEPGFPKFHGFGIIRLEVLETNIDYYDPRGSKDRYLLLIKDGQSELYEEITLMQVGDTIDIDLKKLKLSYYSKKLKQNISYEPGIYGKSFFDHIQSEHQQKL